MFRSLSLLVVLLVITFGCSGETPKDVKKEKQHVENNKVINKGPIQDVSKHRENSNEMDTIELKLTDEEKDKMGAMQKERDRPLTDEEKNKMEAMK